MYNYIHINYIINYKRGTILHFVPCRHICFIVYKDLKVNVWPFSLRLNEFPVIG